MTTLQFLLYSYLNQAEQMLQQMKEMGGNASDLLTPARRQDDDHDGDGHPIVCVYPFMQRYLIKGIMIGAVKG